jgi:hypothetical protein
MLVLLLLRGSVDENVIGHVDLTNYAVENSSDAQEIRMWSLVYRTRPS